MIQVFKFIWRSYWQEAGTISRAVSSVIVTIPAIAAALVSTFGGQWSKDLWPAWVWALLAVIAMLLVIIAGTSRRALALEKATEPKLAVEFKPEPPYIVRIEHSNIPTLDNPRNIAPSIWYRVKVSSKQVGMISKNCLVKVTKLEYSEDGDLYTEVNCSAPQRLRWANSTDFYDAVDILSLIHI